MSSLFPELESCCHDLIITGKWLSQLPVWDEIPLSFKAKSTDFLPNTSPKEGRSFPLQNMELLQSQWPARAGTFLWASHQLLLIFQVGSSLWSKIES